jgi:surface carbohydrate biosynthesis protein (TIGR04326 family)
MKLLVDALPYLPPVLLVLKPHPVCPINPNDYPELTMQVSTDPIAKLLNACDVAYSSPVTSAALDAYCAGVPVVSTLDPSCLNMSPLRGLLGVSFVSTPVALAEALVASVTMPRIPVDPRDFFRLDQKLTKWQLLLT